MAIDFYDNSHTDEQETNKESNVKSVKIAIAKIHQILWEAQQMKPDTALNEVMNLMFLKYLGVFASKTTDNNKIDLLNENGYDVEYRKKDAEVQPAEPNPS